MTPARAALPALTDTDVTELRAHLDRSATPRVRLRAGGTGTVVSVGDPYTDGPEYIKVKVTLGTRDTLPFAPEDLASTSRGPKAAEAKGSPPSPISMTPAPAPPPPAAPSSTKPARSPDAIPSRSATRSTATLGTAATSSGTNPNQGRLHSCTATPNAVVGWRIERRNASRRST